MAEAEMVMDDDCAHRWIGASWRRPTHRSAGATLARKANDVAEQREVRIEDEPQQQCGPRVIGMQAVVELRCDLTDPRQTRAAAFLLAVKYSDSARSYIRRAASNAIAWRSLASAIPSLRRFV